MKNGKPKKYKLDQKNASELKEIELERTRIELEREKIALKKKKWNSFRCKQKWNIQQRI